MSQPPYLLGIDLGTSSCKAVLFDVKGRQVAKSQAPLRLIQTRFVRAEQDPKEWWDAATRVVRLCLKTAKARRGEVESIGISGHGPGVVCVDEAAQPLGNALIWMDRRAHGEVELIGKHVSHADVYARTGHVLDASSSLPKMLWLKSHAAKTYRRTYRFLQSNGFLGLRLTGEYGMDYAHAAAGVLLDLELMDWHDELFAELGLDLEKLPNLGFATDVLGDVNAEAAAETGLAKGSPVAYGSIDGVAGAAGIAPGEWKCLCNIAGTSDVLLIATQRRKLDPSGRLCCSPNAFRNSWVVWGAMSTTGAALDWFSRTFYRSSRKTHVELIEDMWAEAEASEPGARGLLFLPYLAGERSPVWNVSARGMLFGLTLSHTRSDIARAIVESIAFGLKHNLDAISELDIDVSEVRLAGGSVAMQLARQVRADVIGLPVASPQVEEASARGVAVSSGIGAGLYRDVDAASREISEETNRAFPRPKLRDLYTRLYEVYKHLAQVSIEFGPTLGAPMTAND